MRTVVDKKGRERKYLGKILKPAPTSKKGYLGITLYKNGTYKTKKVHRLVAEAFIPNPDNLPEVNHKDENNQNNVFTNLEWATTEYNNRYGTRSKRISENNKKPKQKYTVYQMDLNDNVVNVFKSIRQAHMATGICYDSIRRCGLNEPHYKTAGGFKWKFEVVKPEPCAFEIDE